MDLTAAYKACARITRREARNFYFAFLSLPKAQRRAVYALYAFCREADDVADAAALPTHPRDEKCGEAALLVGGELCDGTEFAKAASPRDKKRVSDSFLVPEVSRGEMTFLEGNTAAEVRSAAGLSREDAERERKRAGLGRLRERLWKAAKGDPETLVDCALADAIDRFAVAPQDLDDVITGVEMDLDDVSLETFEELRTYCYHVASAVGLATLPILNNGVPPTDAMRESAIDLGLGMQFANVLRDVAEDLETGRIYLPAEERARFGVSDEMFRSRTMTRELRALFVFEYERAKRMLAAGRVLIPTVPRTGRGCLWLLSEMYGRVLERIADSGFDVFAGRVSLPTTEKLGLLASTFWRRL